jgi:hypothetical protein
MVEYVLLIMCFFSRISKNHKTNITILGKYLLRNIMQYSKSDHHANLVPAVLTRTHLGSTFYTLYRTRHMPLFVNWTYAVANMAVRQKQLLPYRFP